MFNKFLLNAKMKAAGDSHQSLAAALGMSKTNMSAIWNDRLQWQYKYIAPIAVRYNLTPGEVWEIFFAEDAAEIKKNTP